MAKSEEPPTKTDTFGSNMPPSEASQSRAQSVSEEETISKVGVLELGCGEQPDSRAETTVDLRPTPEADIVHDLDETPWPFADECAEGIILHHVIEHLESPVQTMQELVRIVKPGGWIEIKVPVGADSFRDPTHKNYWTWTTPRYFAHDPDHEWDYYFTLPLDLTDREFTSLWFIAPGLSKASPLFRAIADRFPGEWVCNTPWVAGELTVRYEKMDPDDI